MNDEWESDPHAETVRSDEELTSAATDGGGHAHAERPMGHGSTHQRPRAEDESAGTPPQLMSDSHRGDDSPHAKAGTSHEMHHQGHAMTAHDHAAMGHAMASMDHKMHDHGGTHHNMGAMGHGGHAHHVAEFRRLFWIMAALAIPTVAFSEMFAHLLGYHLPQWSWIPWVSPALGTLMYVWGGWPFLKGAVAEIKSRAPGMMLLIGLAITVAFVASMGASLGLVHGQLDFWWELALLIVIMLLGHWIEMRSLAQSASALDSLAALLPDQAERIDGDEIVPVAPSDLRVGDIALVRPGAVVPADGTIIDGTAHLDESMITGESAPVTRSLGDRVVAGTVSTDSAIRIRVTATGDETALAGIRRLVADAQNSTSRAQLLADKAAAWLFWYALGAAAVTALVWSVLGEPDQAVVRTITVLVIACPHALGLAIPLVVSIATERAARGGVLIRDRHALEEMRTVTTVIFDKTGTLTKGAPTVTDIAPSARTSADEVLSVAASAEASSEHPLARAIVAAANRRGLHVPQAREFATAPAVGVSAEVAGSKVEVGGPRLLGLHGVEELPAANQWRRDGAIIIHVVRDGVVIGALKLADEIRAESREAVKALHAAGIDVVMITGDAEAVATSVATELGIDRVYAGVLPRDKAEKVAQLQDEGRSVAMVGDGVNDAPALARANVGIAIGAGTDVAIASAGVILASDDPRSVLSVVELSRATYRKMKQNLWWAAGYNLLAVPLAAGALASVGFILPMSIGAILMSASTVVVALNAQLLRRLDLSPQASVNRILSRG